MGGRMMAGQGTGEKSLNFLPSFKRLLGHLAPERLVLLGVVVLAVIGIAFNVVGPLLLGRATDIIFTGAIGASLPAGITKEQAVAELRAEGNNTLADLIARLDVVPGQGIDFGALGRVLLLALALYVVASLFMWLQGYLLNGAVQRSIYTLRNQVEAKINRLPLSYFDRQTRGELLSRVTNDIDNVAQALQQTLSQLLTSLLTVVGVMAMMLVVSPLLAAIALVTIPVSILVTTVIGKRSQRLFMAQWKATGELNGHIEEAFTGHSLVKVFGRQREVEAEFANRNESLFRSGFGAQFVSGIIMPTMFFIGNLNYVVIAVVGGLRVASGTISLGDVQAFIQYSRMFTQPLTQLASMANLLQSGVASAERVFEVLDEEEESAEATGVLPPTRGRVAFEHVTFSYEQTDQAVDHRPVPGGRARQHGGHRRSDRGRQDHPGQPGDAVLRAGRRPDHPRRDGYLRRCPAPTCAARSGWCCRTPGCSTAPSGRTSPTAGRTPPRPRSRPRPRRPTWTASCTPCPTATRR